MGNGWRTVWSMGTKCSSKHATVAFADENAPVSTVESTTLTVGSMVATFESLSTEALWSWL